MDEMFIFFCLAEISQQAVEKWMDETYTEYHDEFDMVPYMFFYALEEEIKAMESGLTASGERAGLLDRMFNFDPFVEATCAITGSFGKCRVIRVMG